MVLVPGNSESFEELSEAASGCSSAFVLHGSGCTINELQFWGVGGGIPVTPFGSWSYDFDEQQAKELLADCPHNGILVLHSPPFDTVDRCNNGADVDQRLWRDCLGVLGGHPLTHNALEAGETDTNLILNQLTDGTSPTVLEVVDVVNPITLCSLS